MSKQDIEKRLGFAAQGVKETTRTSAKAAFASPKYRAFVYRGSPSNNVLVKATEFMDSASAAEDAAKQIVMSFRGKPGYPSNNYFADIAQETPEGAKTVKNNIRFSRPGVKAEFVRFMDLETWKNSKGTVFTAGISDNAGQFQPYVTARDSSGGDQLRTLNAPNFKTEKGARKWLNTWMQNNKSTSSRPGVKAEMGIGSYKQGDRTVTVNGKKYEVLPYQMDFFIKELATLDTPEWRADVVKEYLRRGYIKSTSARPGVKAKFEKEYVLWGLPKGETDAIHQQVLSTQAKTPAQMEDVKKRAAAAGWHSFRVQILDLSKPYKGFSRPGVKAKMSESQSKKYFLGRLDVTIADISEINRMLEKQAKSNSKIKAVSSALNKAESLMVAAESKLMQIDFTRPGAKAKFAMKLEKSFKSPNGAREARVFEYNDMYVVRFFSNGQDLKDDYKTEYQDDAFTTARDFVETYNTGRIQ